MNKEEEREYWPRVIREVQRLSGETLEELATRFHVDRRTIVNWKSGMCRPSGFVVVQLYEYRESLYLVTEGTGA